MCFKLSVFLSVAHSNGGCDCEYVCVCVSVAVNMFLVLQKALLLWFACQRH